MFHGLKIIWFWDCVTKEANQPTHQETIKTTKKTHQNAQNKQQQKKKKKKNNTTRKQSKNWKFRLRLMEVFMNNLQVHVHTNLIVLSSESASD